MSRLKKFDNRPKCLECSKPGRIVEHADKKPLCEEHAKVALYDYYFPKLQCHDGVRMIAVSKFDGGEKIFDPLPEPFKEGYNVYYNEQTKAGKDAFVDEDSTRYSELKQFEICDSCESDDGCDGAKATIKYSDGRVTRVTEFHSQDEDGEEDMTFLAGYKHTDAWRGYYEVKSKEYVKVHDDCALSMSEDAENLKQFDEIFTQIMEKQGIEWARVVTRTSNLFSAGVDYYVKKEHLRNFKKLDKLFQMLKDELRNKDTFNRTALTGSSDNTPQSDRFMKAVKLLDRGFSPQEAVKKVLQAEQAVN